MRIKKSQIEEAISNNNKTDLPSAESINQATKALDSFRNEFEKLNDTMDKDGLPFTKKVNENSGDYAEYLAWKDDEVRNAFHEWLVGTPEGQEYAKKYLENQQDQPEDSPTDDLPFESVKNNRKVLKTIKLKNLK